MDFQKDLIQLDQSFQTKEEAIRFCGNLLADGGYVENDYVEAMIQRNKELSVYMGNFIAIPHGTDEAKEKVLKSHPTPALFIIYLKLHIITRRAASCIKHQQHITLNLFFRK